MKPEPTHPGRRGRLLARIRGHQRGRRSITTSPACRGGPTCCHTHSRALVRAARICRHGLVGIRCEPPDQPRHHGMRGHQPEQTRLGRTTANSAVQSPPSANATTRSSTILPTSCTANGSRHGANRYPATGADPSPARSAPTAPHRRGDQRPRAITRSHGRHRVTRHPRSASHSGIRC